jgi:hypothetical protein
VTFKLSRRLVLPPASLLAALALVLVACGSSQDRHSSTADKLIPSVGSTPIASKGDCAHIAAATLGDVGERIYRESSHGANVGEALARVRGSSALASAISAGDAGATRTALESLLANQIAGIEILVRGKVLASAGSGTAIAPVRGSIPGAGASFVLSTQSAQSYLSVTRQVTGAEVLLYGADGRLAGTVGSSPAAGAAGDVPPHDGAVSYAGSHYQAHSIAGGVYPAGPLRIVLLVPHSAIHCPKQIADTQLDTLGHVGERIYEEEAGSPYVRATLRHIEADKPFEEAVAARDTQAVRAAIVGLFAAHIHVVRVRVYASQPSGAQRFLYDLGGPYVLAPVHGLVRSAGTLVGRFSFAIQDDAGYMKLARRFTGADVLMRTGPGGERQVMGTLDPGPARVPNRGNIQYSGRHYRAYSFTGEAFPSGPLRISLLYRAAGGQSGS